MQSMFLGFILFLMTITTVTLFSATIEIVSLNKQMVDYLKDINKKLETRK